MTAHELAKILLDGPDLTVSITVEAGPPWDKAYVCAPAEAVEVCDCNTGELHNQPHINIS